jgi:hypothetical protein
MRTDPRCDKALNDDDTVDPLFEVTPFEERRAADDTLPTLIAHVIVAAVLAGLLVHHNSAYQSAS